MRGKKTFILIVMASFILGLTGWGLADNPAPETKEIPQAPPEPAKLLREMTNYLQSLKQFSYHADVTDDQVYGRGNKLQYSMDMEVALRRPDKLRVNGQGDLENQELFYDGKTLTLYNKDKNLYARAPMPPSIDAALNKAFKDFDLQVSLADLTCGNAYDFLMDDVTHSLYVGLTRVRGVQCHHLAFDQDDFQWQLWIEVGDKPLPRKLLVTQKQLPGSPQWTAYLTDWNFSPQFANNYFTFAPPAGARQIEFLPPEKAKAQTAPRGKKKGQK